jgi:hypothetical protein
MIRADRVRVRASLRCTLLLGAAWLATPPVIAMIHPDQLPSIATAFDDFWTAARGKPFPQQEALWEKYIEGPRATLYRSVVWEVRDHPDWRADRERMLRSEFARFPHIAAAIPAEVSAIQAELLIETKRFRKLFPGASAAPRAVIVLAEDFDSKSGVLPDGTPVLALAADTLALEKADLRILLPHELFHLYDAEHAEVKNDGVMPGTTLALPLFAEGLATYVSSVASPGQADGQYLLQANLGTLPRSRLPLAARDFLRVADTVTLESGTHRISPLYGRWFEGDDRPLNPGYPNRAGYWLGLNLIRQLRRTYSLRQLASWPPAEAQQRIRAALVAMANSKP